jgi:hypothetical protein
MAQVGERVWFQVMAQVGDQVGDQVMALIGERVMFKVMGQFMAQAHRSVQAYFDEPNYSACHFFHEIFEPNDLIHLALFNQMVSGYLPGRKEAWLVRKPILLSRDEQGRLHSVSSMCMQYRDGWGFYAWHGVRCSEKIILEPDRLTREDWMQERNLELRRIIQERLGNDRFVELIGGTIIDRGKRGDLVSVDLLDDPEQEARFVHVRCPSTARRYYLRVPPTVTRADEAVAWTFGLEAGDYQPLQET